MSAPDGFQIVDRAGARDDFLRPLTEARSAISFVAILLWIVGALIVGSVVYLSVLERIRDFAVFKAVGTKSRSIMGGLALQAVIVALIAAVVGAVLSFLLAPRFPLPVEIPTSALWMLPVIAILVGLARQPRRLAARGDGRPGTGLRRTVAEQRCPTS